MNLARHSISATNPVNLLDARFDADFQIFTISTPEGFAVYRAWPLDLVRKRELSGGTLQFVVPCHTSSLLFLVGGGPSPLYPPNKVILWDDAIGSEVAELEFRERVRGIACRRGWLAVSLRRRVVVFTVAEQVTRYKEWDTCDNPRGILAIATGAYSTLLAIAGRQMGHVQLIHLPPCSPPVPKGPPPPSSPRKQNPRPAKSSISMIAAHTSDLTTLTVPPSGRLLATTSSRGTLIRIWDTHTGKLIRELRRGTNKADIYGIAFRPDETEICAWSNNGTVHVFAVTGSESSNRQSSLSVLTTYLPHPKYFDSEWSYAQYRIPTQSSHIYLSSTSIRARPADLPDEDRCVVGWVSVPSDDPQRPPEYQLIALTYGGGWYRLALPGALASRTASPSPSSSPGPASHTVPKSGSRPRPASVSSSTSRASKGKEKERKEGKEGITCILEEFRRFGRWDGWT
ncbi:hypothetical protein EYR36_006209 [Pleurotus pulmonarius]|nr:hypothetical protein EYR36_006209 [Pleurotus pulmonarius]KAF4600915.1 hypothetical protein EYR38_005561 [Pleurotus pulmonarius]